MPSTQMYEKCIEKKKNEKKMKVILSMVLSPYILTKKLNHKVLFIINNYIFNNLLRPIKLK